MAVSHNFMQLVFKHVKNFANNLQKDIKTVLSYTSFY